MTKLKKYYQNIKTWLLTFDPKEDPHSIYFGYNLRRVIYYLRKNDIKKFKSLIDIKKEISDYNSYDNFNNSDIFRILDNKNIRIYLILTEKYIYFILDKKEGIKTIYTNFKKDLKFVIKKEGSVGEIIFNDNYNNLFFDTSLISENRIKEILS